MEVNEDDDDKEEEERESGVKGKKWRGSEKQASGIGLTYYTVCMYLRLSRLKTKSESP